MSGVERFIAGVRELGLDCQQHGALVVVTFDIALADLIGAPQVGTDPPNEFPNAAPHWLHLPCELVLPEGKPRASELGPEWRKWSRAHPRWRGGSGAARRWVAHARSLLLQATRV